jgi:hypothetical protein
VSEPARPALFSGWTLPLIINAQARLTLERFDDRHFCYVMDDALVDPGGLLQFAAARRQEFKAIEHNAYPGICLPAPLAVTDSLRDFFSQHVRRLFDARRTLETHCRLCMVTLAPGELRPFQWLCHRDGELLGPRHSRQASVLYLFRNDSLGGTKFFVPTRSAQELATLFDDAKSLTSADFTRRYAIEAGYIEQSNAYFACVGSIAAKWNRMIFYDGSMLHSGHIAAPAKLSADPLEGRLTLNGFFTSRRNVV